MSRISKQMKSRNLNLQIVLGLIILVAQTGSSQDAAILTEPHPHGRPSATSTETAAKAFYPTKNETQPPATEVDWKFMDRTDVKVSDGVTDATIRYPEEIKALDGKRVSIVGFMAPWQTLSDFTEFMFIPFEVGCVFCSPPPVTQVMLVKQKRTKGGQVPPFAPRSITVTGTLRLFTYDSNHPAHQADFMYALDDAVVELRPGRSGKLLPTPSIFRRKS